MLVALHIVSGRSPRYHQSLYPLAVNTQFVSHTPTSENGYRVYSSSIERTSAKVLFAFGLRQVIATQPRRCQQLAQATGAQLRVFRVEINGRLATVELCRLIRPLPLTVVL